MKIPQSDYLKAISAYNKIITQKTPPPLANISFNQVMHQSALNISNNDNNVIASLLTQTIDKTRDKLRKSEDISNKALYKEAGLTDTVVALSEAEIALQSMITIRDKMISAYQEIMKMQI
jgi:flagellar hook-basal body complex protein FliE